jgi:hypothetical protein
MSREKGGYSMYEFECLTINEAVSDASPSVCSPFYGECYPIGGSDICTTENDDSKR